MANRRGAKKTKKSIFSKLIVLLVITLNVTFTGAILWFFLRTGSEPSSLITAWFAFTTIELWSLAGIKKAEKRKENDYDY